MTTVSPNYQQRGQFNPFYVMKICKKDIITHRFIEEI